MVFPRCDAVPDPQSPLDRLSLPPQVKRQLLNVARKIILGRLPVFNVSDLDLELAIGEAQTKGIPDVVIVSAIMEMRSHGYELPVTQFERNAAPPASPPAPSPRLSINNPTEATEFEYAAQLRDFEARYNLAIAMQDYHTAALIMAALIAILREKLKARGAAMDKKREMEKAVEEAEVHAPRLGAEVRRHLKEAPAEAPDPPKPEDLRRREMTRRTTRSRRNR